MGQELAGIKMPEWQDDVGDVAMSLDLDTIPDDVMEYARTKVGETDNVKTMTLEELKELIYERGEIEPIRMDDDYLIRFLRARNFKVESTYKLLTNYCDFRESNMNLYDGVNPLDLFHVGDAKILSVLPYREQNGRRILVMKIGNWNPSECPMEDMFKATVGTIEAGVLEPRAQILGGVAIFDMEGLTLQHAMHFTPSVVSKIIQIMMTSFPMKIASIHIVNESWIFEKIFTVFKPFLGPRYEEVVHFHGSDLSSLHKHVDPKYLPKGYGGIRPDYDYLEWFLNLAQNDRVIKALDELGYELGMEDKLETIQKIKRKLEDNAA